MLNSCRLKRQVVCLVLPLILFSAARAVAQSEEAKPLNVVFLVADDMGYGDVNAFGGRYGYTPNLDRLAGMGMTMTDFYSACAVCSPTRAALLTGCYPLANGIDGHFPDAPHVFLRDQTRADGGPGTLPGMLREQGYSTLHIGKWHLGGITLVELEHRATGQGAFAQNLGPHEHGFEQYFASLEDAESGIRSGMIRQATLYRDATKHLIHNDVYQPDPEASRDWTGFKGDIATQQVAAWAVADQPFFLNVWFDVPHTPYESDHVPPPFHFDTLSQHFDDVLGRHRHVLNPNLPEGKGQEDHRRFLSMVTYMDFQVGRILDALEDPNADGDSEDSLLSHTLIVFTSDNGGAWPADNGVFASGKACVREGGIRVPMIVAWQDRITARTTTAQLGNTIDLMPSVLRLCGAVGALSDQPAGVLPDVQVQSLPQTLNVDGIDLSNVWLGTEASIDRGVMFSDLRRGYRPQRHDPPPEPVGALVARHGDLKLLFHDKHDLEAVALFDLANDPAEQVNLVDQPEYADRIAELTQATALWLAEMHAAAGADG